MLNLNNATIFITEQCQSWCSEQHIAHYGNELLMFPKIALLCSFLAIIWFEYGNVIIKRYPYMIDYDKPIFMALLYLITMFLLIFFIYFWKTYGG